MSQTLHVEVARSSKDGVKASDLKKLLKDVMGSMKNPAREFSLHDPKNAHIKEFVSWIKFSSATNTFKCIKAASPDDDVYYSKSNIIKSPDKIEYHVFKLSEEGESMGFLEEGGHEQSPFWHQWNLPSQAFHDLWENLVFEPEVKTQLMDYIRTVILYSDKMVNESLTPCSKIILLHGPPGTGKTSLCKALAHKAAIRLGSRFNYAQLIEINSHSLFSKFSSESAKIILKVFEKIQELIVDTHSVTFLLLDEVESLACRRPSDKFDSETGAAIRTVNAILDQIDRIKKYPNVIILTTSNLVASVDEAFVDRADLKIYIGNPSVESIYQILATSINELIRVDIVQPSDGLYLPRCAIDSARSKYASRLMELSQLSVSLSGRVLRKIAFLTHVHFVKGEACTLLEFLESLEVAICVEKEDSALLKSKSKLRPKPDPHKYRIVDFDEEEEGEEEEDCQVIDIEYSGERRSQRTSNAKRTNRRTRGRPSATAKRNRYDIRPSTNQSKAESKVKVEGESSTRLKQDQKWRSSRSTMEQQDNTKCEDDVISTRKRSRQSEVNESIGIESGGGGAKPVVSTKVKNSKASGRIRSGIFPSTDVRKYELKAGVKLKECFVDLSKSIISEKKLSQLLNLGASSEAEKRRKRSPSVDIIGESIASPSKISKSDTTTVSRSSSPLKCANSQTSSRSSSEVKESNKLPAPSPEKPSTSQNTSSSSSSMTMEERRKSLTESKSSKVGDSSKSVKPSLAQRPRLRPADRPKGKLAVGQNSPKRTNNATSTNTTPASSPQKKSTLTNTVTLQRAIERVIPEVKSEDNRHSSPGIKRLSTSCSALSSDIVIVLDGPPKTPTCKKDILPSKGKKGAAAAAIPQELPQQNIVLMTQTSDGKVVSVNGKPSGRGFKTPTYNCDQCEFSFYFKRELNKHYAIHLDPSSISCQQCHRTFTKPEYRKKHEMKCMLKTDASPDTPVPPTAPIVAVKSKAPVPIISNGVGKANGVPISTSGITVRLNESPIQQLGTIVNAVKSSPAKVSTPPPCSYSYKQLKSPAIASKDGNGFASPKPLVQSPSPSTHNNNNNNRVSGPKSVESDEGYGSGLQQTSSGSIFSNNSGGESGRSPASMYLCSLCPKTFPREASLHFHIEVCHKVGATSMEQQQQERYSCAFCGRLFSSHRDVTDHEASEHGPGSCGSSYAQQSSVESSVPPDTPNSLEPLSVSSVHTADSGGDLVNLQGGLSVPSVGNSNSFEESFRSNNTLEPMDFQLDNYHHCSLCGNCFINSYELTQHLQSIHEAIPVPSTPIAVEHNFLLGDNLPIPVPDAETVIEVETSDEFLNFLSAF